MTDKIISCGAIIIMGEKFLIGRPSWKNNVWNIPKGTMNPNESEYDTAVREIKEECNIDIQNLKTVCIGKLKYLKNKDLVLYAVYLNDEEYTVQCNSTWSDVKGNLYPEMVDFKWIGIDEYDKYLNLGLKMLFESNYDMLYKLIKGEKNQCQRNNVIHNVL